MRGTNPSLTQTLHQRPRGRHRRLVRARTRWALVGRSVSYTLLPSELVSQVIVRKSSHGRPGRRRRRRHGRHHHAQAAALPQAVHRSKAPSAACMPTCRTRPTRSSTRSSTGRTTPATFGVLLQGFSEKRHLRRDGQEMLGYDTISPAQRARGRAPRPRRRRLSHADRLGALRAGARAHGRPDRHPVPAERRRSSSTCTSSCRTWRPPTTTATRCSGARTSSRRRQPPPTRATGAQQHAGARPTSQPARPGTNASTRSYDQISRPDAVSETELPHLDAKWQAQRQR